MSLACIETREIIMYGAPLYCGTPKDAAFICGLSQEALDRIPMAERLPQPCATATDGVDIHTASSDGEPTFRGAYQWSSLKKGRFLFSVSARTAQECLPKLWAEFQPGHPPTPPIIDITVETLPLPSTTVH